MNILLLFCYLVGPEQLAAVGVAIAIFNQASKVTIFPLVSITTSFVAEEDTIERMNSKLPEEGDSKKISAKNKGIKELLPEDAALENLEKGSASKNETKELTPGEGTEQVIRDVDLRIYVVICYAS